MGEHLLLIPVAVWYVDSRARHHQLLQCGVLLRLDERSLVLKPELYNALPHVVVEFEPFLRFHREQKVKDALADRGNFANERQVPIFKNDPPARNDHHCVRLVRFEKSTQSL
jgi:hypothetical protein